VDADITGFNIDRFHPYQNNPRYRRERTEESLGLVYKCHYPTYTMQSARGVKKSVIHDRLAAERAYFKETSGWEGADWFAPVGVEPVVDKLCWNRHNWFPYWAAEHKAARENVVLIDMSFMSKFMVQGRDAGAVLNWISANNVDGAVGEIVYTQWLNEKGKMEGDLTVTKLAEDKFFLVVTDTQHRHALAWLNRNIASDKHCIVTDVTGGYSQFNLQGPKSRELMQKLTSQDMSDEAFPFRCAKDIDVGLGRVMCTRITYVGELGYELFVPTEHALHVYDEIKAHGEGVGLVHAGLKALGSLRLEKGYRDYGHDMDNTDTILECGLGFAVAFDKPGGFIGKDAVMAQREKKIVNLPKRLVSVLCNDPEPMLFHAEILLRDGEPMGYVRVGSYGHTLGGAVGLALVERPCSKRFIEEGVWELDIAGKKYPATVSLGPLYDPKNEKIKC
jgi:heterotetrameric sarcosine oxidase gamma subunit